MKENLSTKNEKYGAVPQKKNENSRISKIETENFHQRHQKQRHQKQC